jgi:hypothetical protein
MLAFKILLWPPKNAVSIKLDSLGEELIAIGL